MTLNSTSLKTTACFGSSSRMAAGAQAWQRPNQVGVQVPAGSHLLSCVPYEELPRTKVVLPQRQKRGNYKDSNYSFKYVKERY